MRHCKNKADKAFRNIISLDCQKHIKHIHTVHTASEEHFNAIDIPIYGAKRLQRVCVCVCFSVYFKPHQRRYVVPPG